MCVSDFPISLGFCPDPKDFTVNFEENIVKLCWKMGENIVKNPIFSKKKFLDEAGGGGYGPSRLFQCKSLGGAKTGDPEKKHLTTRKQNLACFTYDPSEARTHSKNKRIMSTDHT